MATLQMVQTDVNASVFFFSAADKLPLIVRKKQLHLRDSVNFPTFFIVIEINIFRV